MRFFAVNDLANPSYESRLTLGKIIASGGAGDIRVCEQDPNLVIKMYKSSSDASKYKTKLAVMLKTPPLLPILDIDGEPFHQLTWPKDLVIDEQGRFAGYRMPKISLNQSVSLERFLQRRMREHEGLPEFYAHRINAAHNLAVVVEALNKRGHHIIDLKPQNCFMHRSKLYLTLLDCDGFSISSEEGMVFPAYQYSEEYIAPEFLKKLPEELGEHQDRFALAVIVFKLLNNGIHPFQAGMKTAQKTISQMVSEKKYAYGVKGSKNLIPHNQSLHEYFPDELREAFDRAFTSKTNRPSASEWRELLHDIHNNKSGLVERCEQNPSEHLDLGKGCGHCAIAQGRSLITQSKQAVTKQKRHNLKAPKTPKPRHQVFKKRILKSKSNIIPLKGHSLNDIIPIVRSTVPVKFYHICVLAGMACYLISVPLDFLK